MKPKDTDTPGAVNECGKVAYTSRSIAKRAEKRGRGTGFDHMDVYQCPDCERWHVGHNWRTNKPLRSTKPLKRTTPVKPVSSKRAKEQRQRSKMLAEVFGTSPACARCGAPADDAHELLSRARGGSIVDPQNIAPLCRSCHRWVTVNPRQAETEGWALSRKDTA